jgi:pimeloyl-ACP methyl ester carboxylesterase
MSPKPYRIDVSEVKLDRIRTKLAAGEIGYTPDDDTGWKYGADAGYLAEFRDYWLNRYDWRAREAELNRYPQFMVEIDGIDIHYYHVRGQGSDRFPLILTHGWPGSIVEFQQAIPLLVAQGFDVVVPSLPGYGFSSRPARPIGMRKIAEMWRKLMVDVLKYRRFGAQGGDWGAGITMALGREHADVVCSIHLNLIFHVPMESPSDEYMIWQGRMGEIMAHESAYMHLQQSKPQTIGLALADSPIGFAAWVLEKYHGWADTRGNIERRLSKDQMITNIMTYLVNDSVQSAIWLYYGAATEAPASGSIALPFGFANFPGEFVPPPPRKAVEQAFNLVHWADMPSGGHFAAWEEPVAFAKEVGSFFTANR